MEAYSPPTALEGMGAMDWEGFPGHGGGDQGL